MTPSLVLSVTAAGRAALTNAHADGVNALRVTQCGLTATAFTPDEHTTKLPDESKRIDTLSGGATAPDTIHVNVRDSGSDSYTVRGLALYFDDGTLFAAYGQADPIVEKSAASILLLQLDMRFLDIDATQITFGDANFSNPQATTETPGVVELATPDEAAAGTDAQRAVTPKGLAAYIVKQFTTGQTLATSGCQSLPGGLYFQWGRGPFASRVSMEPESRDVLFTNTFPNELLGIFQGVYLTDPQKSYTAQRGIRNPSRSGFTSVVQKNQLSGTFFTYYLAIGY